MLDAYPSVTELTVNSIFNFVSLFPSQFTGQSEEYKSITSKRYGY